MTSVVVFGATGFTGSFVVRELDSLGMSDVVLVGRSKAKLDALQSKFPVEVCDLADGEAVYNIVKQHAAVVIHCAGPFRLFGEVVVKAVVELGRAYVDLSGEPEFLEKMELSYHENAVASGAVVVSACGFDSIPADIGALLVKNSIEQQAKTPCKVSIEGILDIYAPEACGPTGNYGTYHSLVKGLASAGDGELRRIRNEYKKKYPFSKHPEQPRLKKLDSLFGTRHPQSSFRLLPFPGADASIVRRSHRGQPVSFTCYFTVASWWAALKVNLRGALMMLLSKTGFGTRLLLDYPLFFSAGAIGPSGVNPSEEARQGSSFRYSFFGSGSALGQTGSSSFEAKCIFAGRDPGYEATAAIAVAAALTLLESRSNKESRPAVGVLTTAQAFAGCLDALVNRLRDKLTVTLEGCAKNSV